MTVFDKVEKQNLDHQVWKLIKQHGLEDRRILVALSGGIDSLALLCVLKKVHPSKLLGACYFHHGEEFNQIYRHEAEEFCRRKCESLRIAFYPLKSKVSARSEEQYRERRYRAIEQLKRERNFEILATGHHRDDLLETRLMRLIRGTGAQGLQAMCIFQAGLFRPFLEITKKELRDYLKVEKQKEFPDPSNKNLDPFRNWLRQRWLKVLDKRIPGGVSALARSLETIAQEVEQQSWGDLLHQNEAYKSQGLQRSFYLTLSLREQRRLLAQYLFALGKRDFSQSQIEEIQKRLDNSQKVITFKVAGCNWSVTAQQVKVES